jgi:hypothetical protein
MGTDNQVASWEQDQRLVLSEMKRNAETMEAIRTEMGVIRVEVAVLKIKSGLWGLTAGAVPVIIALGIKSLG